jgi:rare lipoprotein A
MFTNLRIGGLIAAAGLLGISPTSAASQTGKPQKTQAVTANRRARPLGMASWYGERHQGRKMANGQKFDRHALTAASWTLPLGTTIRVVNLRNSKSVVVTVTDRGPAHRLHRVLDLSEAAAQQLDYVEQGLTPIFYSQEAFFEPEESAIDRPLVEPPAGNLLTADMVGEPAL